MRFLVVHQNFPGQFLHLLRHLGATGRHDIVFISEHNPNRLEGVRRLTYGMPANLGQSTYPSAHEFEAAMVRAHAVATIGFQVKRLGFTPDIVLGHEGWGELLNIDDVWPGVPILGYQEFFYHLEGYDVGFDPEFPSTVEGYGRIRAKNAVNLIGLTNRGHHHSPTAFQRGTFPAWAQPSISLLPEGVNLDLCRPMPESRRRPFRLGDITVSPKERLVTYVSRDLEPYRGFHTLMRALPKLLAARRDVRVVMVGGDGTSYGAKLAQGTWRERLLAELDGRLDTSRIHFPGKVEYADYLRLLQRSDAHVYLTYPFVLSWSFREAMAAGCVVVGSDTPPVREFLTHRQNGLLAPFLEPDTLADTLLEAIEDRKLAARLSANARAYAEAHFDLRAYLAAYETLIDDVIERRV